MDLRLSSVSTINYQLLNFTRFLNIGKSACVLVVFACVGLVLLFVLIPWPLSSFCACARSMKLQENKDVLAQPQDDLLEKWKEEAERLKKLICLSDAPELAKIAFIGGLDLSFVEDDASLACAALVVSTYPDCKVKRQEDVPKIFTI